MNYCTLEQFENMVMKKDNENENYYILSPYFSWIPKSGIFLNKLSIFDKIERGTISKDKEMVNKILTILKSGKSIEEKTSDEKKEKEENKNKEEKESSKENKTSGEKKNLEEEKTAEDKNISEEKKSSEDNKTLEEKIKLSPEEKKAAEEKKKKLENLEISDLEKRSIGSMMGMAIGDAMGSTYEFNDVNYDTIDLFDMEQENKGAFNLEPGQWTDDCSMGLCIADSLLVNDGELKINDLMLRFLAWMSGGYNNAFRFNVKHNLYPRQSVGLGGNISMALFRYYTVQNDETDAGDKNTSGNGSIMRNAAIPICFYYDLDKACQMARKQSLSTHQGLEAKECCSLLTFIIVQILNPEIGGKKSLKEILDNLGNDFKTDVPSVESLAKSIPEKDNPDRDWNWKKDKFRYNEERAERNPGYIGAYAMDNMAMSLHIIYHTESFKEAIIRAVNIRGDSDSVASVVGQIAGAYYPIEEIPSQWIERINKWDEGEIALRGYMLSRLNSKKSVYNNK